MTNSAVDPRSGIAPKQHAQNALDTTLNQKDKAMSSPN